MALDLSRAKSAEELHITEHQRAAIAAIAIMADEGTLTERHLHMTTVLDQYPGYGTKQLEQHRLPPCGTIGCIMGWADYLYDTALEGNVKSTPLYKLFYEYPPTVTHDPDGIARACVNYLNGARDPWAGIR